MIFAHFLTPSSFRVHTSNSDENSTANTFLTTALILYVGIIYGWPLFCRAGKK